VTKAFFLKSIAVFFIISACLCQTANGGKLRVVSLAPNITEILFALGLTEKEIVGATDYCDYPDAVNKILKVGSLTTVNIETIIALEPDYVFSVGNESGPLNSRLKNVGLNVVVVNAENIDETFTNIIKIGEILNRGERAKETVDQMRRRLLEVKNKVAKIKNKKRVYVEIWDDPLTSCGRGSLVDEVITKAGGKNITGNIRALYPTINQEIIINRNPDFIILGYMSRNQKNSHSVISGRPGWQDIHAVKEKNIISDIDPNIFLRPGPRIINGIEEIYERLYKNQ
jgi:iron complex transport system substrate-binding protein